MKSLMLGLAACMVFGLSAATQAQNAGGSGTLEFRGAIVDPLCEYGVAGTMDFGSSTRFITVALNVALAVNMANKTCRQRELPFVASYQALKNVRASKDVSVEKGVITISYK